VCGEDAHAYNPEDRERVVDYTRSLEEHPLAKDNLAKRMWLTEWIVKAPDVTVDVCCKELQSLDEVNNTYSEQLRMQAMYSQAAFELEHPDVTNSATIQAAGLAGTLRAYRAILRFDPSAKYPVLDNLLSLEKQGKLQKVRRAPVEMRGGVGDSLRIGRSAQFGWTAQGQAGLIILLP
jgi:hypothetical protein